MTERVTETELQAYVDDQLDAAGRVEVCDYLLAHPHAAQRVLLDLRHRDAMIAMAGAWCVTPTSRIETAAGALQRAIAAPQRRRFLKPAAGLVAALVVLEVIGPQVRESGRVQAALPAYVEEAMEARQTSMVRAAMASQIEAPTFDPADVRAATNISVPALPADWRLRDVQVFPSDYGPSLQLVADVPDGGPNGSRVALFAARARDADRIAPGTARISGQEVIYWSRDGNIYVLTGTGPAAALRAHARDLADNRDA